MKICDIFNFLNMISEDMLCSGYDKMIIESVIAGHISATQNITQFDPKTKKGGTGNEIYGPGCYFLSGKAPSKFYLMAYNATYSKGVQPAQYVVKLDIDEDSEIIPLEKPVNIKTERPQWLKRMSNMLKYFLDKETDEKMKKKVYKSYYDVVYSGR